MIKNSNDRFYTESEIAKRFKITTVTLIKLRKAGEIDFIRIGGSIRYPQHVYDGILKKTIAETASEAEQSLTNKKEG